MAGILNKCRICTEVMTVTEDLRLTVRFHMSLPQVMRASHHPRVVRVSLPNSHYLTITTSLSLITLTTSLSPPYSHYLTLTNYSHYLTLTTLLSLPHSH